MKKYLIIPIVAVVISIFIFGIYAGATKTFPYNIIKSVKDDLNSDLSNIETSVISNFDAKSLRKHWVSMQNCFKSVQKNSFFRLRRSTTQKRYIKCIIPMCIGLKSAPKARILSLGFSPVKKPPLLIPNLN